MTPASNNATRAVSKKSKYLKIGISLAVIFIATIGPLYLVAICTGLPGMRGGPQDAFRHTFASALVSNMISPGVVDFVTKLCERDDDAPMDRMDRHNNRIGKNIGAESPLKDLYSRVSNAIAEGKVDSKEQDKITWLAEENWSLGL